MGGQKILLYLSLVTLLLARENPFFPHTDPNLPMPSSNITTKKEALTKESFALSEDVRVLKSVTFELKNLDGSIIKKSFEVDKEVDWRKNLLLTQDKTTTQTTKQTDAPLQKEIKTSRFSATIDGKSVQIFTKDTLLRDFLLASPYRVVLDFDSKERLKQQSFAGSGVLKEFRVGLHDGYYRVVLELDGRYRYTLSKTDSGYKIVLQ